MKTKTSLLIAIACFALCSFTVLAADTKEYKIEKDGFEWYEVNRNGKAGALDKNGKTLIPIEYKWLYYTPMDDNGYDNGFFTCKSESSPHTGLFDKKGKCIVSPTRNYNSYLLKYGDGDKDGASVMVTQTGSSYMPCNEKPKHFTIYNYIHAYNGCWVNKETGTVSSNYENSNYKFIGIELLIFDITGKVVFEPQKRYINLDAYYEKGHFFFITKLLQEDNPMNSKFGVIDANENIVIPFKYRNEIKYKNGNFVTTSNGKEVVIGNVSSVKTTKNLFVGGSLNNPQTQKTASNTSTPTKSSTTTQHTHSHRSYPVTLAYCLDGTSQNIKTREVYRQGPQMGFITFYEDKIVVDNKDTYTFWKGDDEKGVKMYQGKAISAHGATAIPVIAKDENLEYVVLFVNVGNATSQARVWLMEVDDFYALWQANQGINNQIFITNSYGEHPSTIPNNDVGTKSYFRDNYGYKECYMCHGSGICPTCNGRGLQHNGFGLDDSKCANCHGNGKCRTCHGTGKVYGKKY